MCPPVRRVKKIRFWKRLSLKAPEWSAPFVGRRWTELSLGREPQEDNVFRPLASTLEADPVLPARQRNRMLSLHLESTAANERQAQRRGQRICRWSQRHDFLPGSAGRDWVPTYADVNSLTPIGKKRNTVKPDPSSTARSGQISAAVCALEAKSRQAVSGEQGRDPGFRRSLNCTDHDGGRHERG
jgi:hypothetical protein